MEVSSRRTGNNDHNLTREKVLSRDKGKNAMKTRIGFPEML